MSLQFYTTSWLATAIIDYLYSHIDDQKSISAITAFWGLFCWWKVNILICTDSIEWLTPGFFVLLVIANTLYQFVHHLLTKHINCNLMQTCQVQKAKCPVKQGAFFADVLHGKKKMWMCYINEKLQHDSFITLMPRSPLHFKWCYYLLPCINTHITFSVRLHIVYSRSYILKFKVLKVTYPAYIVHQFFVLHFAPVRSIKCTVT